MGTNDLLTAQYISNLLGISTVETSSIRKDAEFDGMFQYGVESTSSVRRNLLNPDEIIRMNNDEQIVMIRGQKPFKCKKLRYWEYRLGANIKQTMIEDYIPPNITREFKKFEDEKNEEKLPTFEEFLKGRR